MAHEKFHDLVINKLRMFNGYVTMSQITIGLCSLGDGDVFGNVDIGKLVILPMNLG